MMLHQLIAVILFTFLQFSEAANYALLAAGSKGYKNYRHQADVAHGYQLLIQHGIPASNIVTMVFDDIAYNPANPFPGNIINEPNGPNVYAGMQKDYVGYDVTAQNFLKVLSGDRNGMRGIGSGRVIESGPNDNVFVYYSDHGAKDLIAFPANGPLLARDLNYAIVQMFNNRKYKNMVLYIEACFSGSMFYQKLFRNLNVYAMTAANHQESSYSCYYDKARNAYLADEFSAHWMKDSERTQNMLGRTLNEQYNAVKTNTRNSHVMQFGDLTHVGALKIGNFHGTRKLRYSGGLLTPEVPITDAVPTWEVPYMLLKYQLDAANTTEARLEILEKMEEEVEARALTREGIKKIAEKFVSRASHVLSYAMSPATPEQNDCYQDVIGLYKETCVDDSRWEYALQDLHVFENLCIIGESTENIKAALREVC